MNITTLPSWLQSSQDPTQVANKVKGFVLLLSSMIIFFAASFLHIQLSATDVTALATELAGVAGAVWTIYGFVLNVITWFGKLPKGKSVVVPATDPSLQ